MKILLTAFEPFGGERVNAALEAMRRTPERMGDGEIVKLTVPTVFGKSTRTVTEAIHDLCPDAVLCLGQAAGRSQLTPERVAINVDDARIPDNEGNRPEDRPIVPDGPAAYFSTLPIRAMTEAIRRTGAPAAISNTAGTFVCNHLMYGVLHALKKEGLSIPAGFMHVPCTPEQTAERPELPSLPLDGIAAGVAAALGVLLQGR